MVTRLGEFSPLGLYYLWAVVVKIIGLLFSTEKKFCNHFDKNGFGYILGDSFTSLSGHPGSDRPRVSA
jgi:hypothetical protein